MVSRTKVRNRSVRRSGISLSSLRLGFRELRANPVFVRELWIRFRSPKTYFFLTVYLSIYALLVGVYVLKFVPGYGVCTGHR